MVPGLNLNSARSWVKVFEYSNTQLGLKFKHSTHRAYINLFMRHLCEPEDNKTDTFSDGVPKDNISRQNILTRIGILRLVKNKVRRSVVEYFEIPNTVNFYSAKYSFHSLHYMLQYTWLRPLTD